MRARAWQTIEARECELVLVIGSSNSSNSNRLVEVARDTAVLNRALQYAATFGYTVWLRPADPRGRPAGAGQVALSASVLAAPGVASFLAGLGDRPRHQG